jgi:hypothetical protein
MTKAEKSTPAGKWLLHADRAQRLHNQFDDELILSLHYYLHCLSTRKVYMIPFRTISLNCRKQMG